MANVLIAVWLILVGITWIGWVAISATALGVFALITGVIAIAEHFGVLERIQVHHHSHE